MATRTAPHPYQGDPRFIEAGRSGALKRWGGQRIVRLDSFDPTVRDALLALLRAMDGARKEPDR
jgi:hypothetical protein